MSEAMRLKILNKLTSVIGEEEATHLMENIPPFDWHELATKEDLNTQSVLINAQFTAMRGEFAEKIGVQSEMIGGLHKEIGGLRGEIGGLHKEIGGLHKEIGGLRGEIAGLHVAIAGQTKTMVLVFAGSALTVCAALAGGILFA